MGKSIQIDAEDWIISAGLIGLSRLFQEDDSMITQTGIKLTEHHFNDISERFFNYLLNNFSVVKRDVKKDELVL
ncbi:MAG: hypothetical protein LRY73_14715 [Bacillus sp. (in: Bacteria)]|nr:hypothetical protein [Bacillus sp. (in: firmicutes)]